MSGWRAGAAPTRGDLLRLKVARQVARDLLAKVDERRAVIRFDAFRAELASTVRSVSPFLLSLLETNGLSLDDVVLGLQPPTRWPLRPVLLDMTAKRSPVDHFLRHAAVGMYPNDRLRGTRSSVMVPMDCGGWMAVRVEAHSIEVSACLGDATFFTRFGTLEIRLNDSIPETMAAAAPGRLAAELVGHPALDGREWRVFACEVEIDPERGTMLSVETGAAECRLPWGR